MSEPFISITTSKIKEGKVEDFKRFYRELVEVIEANEPRLIAFHAFLSEDGTEVTGIQFHPDAASVDFHLQVLGEKMRKSFEFIELKSSELYGTPGARLAELNRQLAASGVRISVKPLRVGGFTRSAAG
jgi:hypothetical protein